MNNIYFIVDCHHHRILYSDIFHTNISLWKRVDYEFSGPHSIATDGENYVIDNTGANEVVVLDKNLKFKQSFQDILYRPHRTVYDPITDSFFVVTVPYLFCFKKNAYGRLFEHFRKSLPFLADIYVRSISIIDGNMYFVSGNSKIVVANYLNESFDIINEYDTTDELAGMNDIVKIGKDFYITSTQNRAGDIAPKMIKTTNLNTLVTGDYEDIYSTFRLIGTPYYMSVFDNSFFVTEIGTNNAIHKVSVNELSTLSSIQTIMEFRGALEESINRKNTYPL